MTTTATARPDVAPELPTVILRGLRFAAVTEPECVEYVMRKLRLGEGGWMMTPNLDILRQICSKTELRELAEQTDVRVADGMPLVWASRIKGTPLPERVTGSNLVFSLSQAAAENGFSVYLLGGDESTAELAGAELQRRYPGLRIAGSYYPPMGFEKDRRELDRIVESVVQAKPDLVFVALGFPKQTHLIHRIRAACPAAWWMGVGISFSFVAGHVKRAPKWMQRTGLEWLHRMVQEPRRLVKRYLLHGIPFAIRLLSGAVVERFRKHPADDVMTASREVTR